MRHAKLYDREVEEHLKEALEIDDQDLKTEFSRTPGDIAYWNARYGDAIQVALESEEARQRLEAELGLEYRERFSGEGKKITEETIKAAVRSDERYRLARRAEMEAEAEKWRARGYALAILAKKDMLMSLGAMVRDELRGDPVVRDLDGLKWHGVDP